MELIEVMFIRAVAAIVAAFVVFWLSMSIMRKVMWEVRENEDKPNRATEPPDQKVMAWYVVHIRDDIASLNGLLSLSNALLAAILVVMVLG